MLHLLGAGFGKTDIHAPNTRRTDEGSKSANHHGLGFRVSSVGQLGVQGLGFSVQGLGFRVWGGAIIRSETGAGLEPSRLQSRALAEGCLG